MTRGVWIVAGLLLAGCAAQGRQDGKLSLTPPMGWMSWEIFRCETDCASDPDNCINDKLYMTSADALAEGGYLAAGYDTIHIDDCWERQTPTRDPNTDRLVPNATRFPDGMKAVADYVHGKGVKFGLYTAESSKTCGGYPASKDHEVLDASTFAEWGVDYLKVDGCGDTSYYNEGYPRMGSALQNQSRDIVYSCSWPAYLGSDETTKPYERFIEIGCNLWRNWNDIQCNWASLSSIIDHWGQYGETLRKYAGPGHWNDPDMLLIGNDCINADEARTQMAIWSIVAAPLIMGNDVRNISAEHRNILLNKDAIASGGRLATCLVPLGPTLTACHCPPASPQTDGSSCLKNNAKCGWVNNNNYMYFDKLDKTPPVQHLNISLRFADVGLAGPVEVYDIWAQKSLGVAQDTIAQWDLETGRLFIGDVGGNDPVRGRWFAQRTWKHDTMTMFLTLALSVRMIWTHTTQAIAEEEVTLYRESDGFVNMGWPFCEGFRCYETPTSDYHAPVLAWPHNNQQSAVVAGFVYRGSHFPPSLYGTLFYGDYGLRFLNSAVFDETGSTVEREFLFDTDPGQFTTLEPSPREDLWIGMVSGKVDRYFYLEDPYGGPVPQPITVPRDRYVLLPEPMNFTSALAACSKLEAIVVAPVDEHERLLLELALYEWLTGETLTIVPEVITTYVDHWVALARDGRPDVLHGFQWLEGSAYNASATPWQDGEPNNLGQVCVWSGYNGAGMFDDDNCAAEHHVVCDLRRGVPELSSTTPGPTSTTWGAGIGTTSEMGTNTMPMTTMSSEVMVLTLGVALPTEAVGTQLETTVNFDGLNVSLPVTLTLPVGSRHVLHALSSLCQNYALWVFTGWNVGGPDRLEFEVSGEWPVIRARYEQRGQRPHKQCLPFKLI
ncbi:uncharacterized protein MONBRDRAFT_38878 [Monosiga brevicollis MX1]|uniref:Alpha-galactosidase n=1 Tax=Monosiga brevicollis TaxID=81824 RepID=A9VAR6_MONBE|nr:uncharacterized protein MONBRDRAFT_38878 [Monosiga brevicollis MX1]EDQ85367.1 predicted protein [Monosiga brevicollis MX1]|eukprot:XP_001749778.1 hypothetical protein [Monosiga brevicollis MX1]